MSESDKKNAGLIKEREDLLKEVLSVTKEQPGLLSSGDYDDGLLDNISRRQVLLDRIEALGAGDLPPSSAEKTLIADIKRQDAINERMASDLMQDLREKLRRNRDGLTSLRGYDRQGGVDAVYFDKQK